MATDVTVLFDVTGIWVVSVTVWITVRLTGTVTVRVGTVTSCAPASRRFDVDEKTPLKAKANRTTLTATVPSLLGK